MCTSREFSPASPALVAVATLLSIGWLARALPLGADPALASIYEGSNGEFACLDGSGKIPLESVNDDFCDCADGSDEPGTSACVRGSFYCLNIGHDPVRLASRFVGDGVSDCCDGSDEPAGAFPDTCREKGRAELEGLRAAAAAAEKGAKRRREYEKKGLERLAGLRKEVARLDADLRRRRETKSALDERVSSLQARRTAAERADAAAAAAALAAPGESAGGQAKEATGEGAGGSLPNAGRQLAEVAEAVGAENAGAEAAPSARQGASNPVDTAPPLPGSALAPAADVEESAEDIARRRMAQWIPGSGSADGAAEAVEGGEAAPAAEAITHFADLPGPVPDFDPDEDSSEDFAAAGGDADGGDADDGVVGDAGVPDGGPEDGAGGSGPGTPPPAVKPHPALIPRSVREAHLRPPARKAPNFEDGLWSDDPNMPFFSKLADSLERLSSWGRNITRCSAGDGRMPGESKIPIARVPRNLQAKREREVRQMREAWWEGAAAEGGAWGALAVARRALLRGLAGLRGGLALAFGGGRPVGTLDGADGSSAAAAPRAVALFEASPEGVALLRAKEALAKASTELRTLESEHRSAKAKLEELAIPEAAEGSGDRRPDGTAEPDLVAWAALSETCLRVTADKYEYEACPFGSAAQVEGGSRVDLGRWKGIRPEEPEGVGAVAAFEDGARCWNGPKRSLTLRLVCGAEDTLKDVQEPSRCEYTALLETPAACTDEVVEAARLALASRLEATGLLGHTEL